MGSLVQVCDRLELGDWRLLHLLAGNMEPRVFGELVEVGKGGVLATVYS